MLRKNGIVPHLFRLGVEHCPGPVSLAVVLELEGVSAHEYFRRADKALQSLLIVAHKTLIHPVGSIAGHDEKNRNPPRIAAGILTVVGEVLENQPLVQCPEGSSQL